MSLIELVLMAISLAMDAFAVSICNGLAMRRVTVKKALTFGIYFGVFQALMPFLGYTLGIQFAGLIEAFDHWIAVVLLAFIGGKMVESSLAKDEGAPADEPELSLRTMLPLAIATSIDALAMGVTLAVIGADIVPAVSLIGLITLLLSSAGVYIGHRFGLRFKSKAELLGGVTLILIGVKILLQHLGILG
jgi:Predicted membrane protein